MFFKNILKSNIEFYCEKLRHDRQKRNAANNNSNKFHLNDKKVSYTIAIKPNSKGINNDSVMQLVKEINIDIANPVMMEFKEPKFSIRKKTTQKSLYSKKLESSLAKTMKNLKQLEP